MGWTLTHCTVASVFAWCPAGFSLSAITILYNMVSYDTEADSKKVIFSGFA